MKKFITIAIATLALVPALSQPAFSQQGAAPTRSVAVERADLDLGQPAGRSALEHRIRLAADALCGRVSAFDLAGANAVRRCRFETIAVAMRALPEARQSYAATR